MGAWGYKEMDSDDAQDQVHEELLRIKKRLSKILRLKNKEYERMGVAALVKSMKSAFILNIHVSGEDYIDLVREAVSSLQRMLEDSYISSWENSNKARASIRRQMRGLEKAKEDVIKMM